MERRNRSLKALKEFQYIDSLDDNLKAPSMQQWVEDYLTEDIQKSFDLELPQLKQLEELFYKNINFIKEFRSSLKKELDNSQDIKKFFN